MQSVQEVKLSDHVGNVKRGSATHLIFEGSHTFTTALCGVRPSAVMHVKGWLPSKEPCSCRNCQKSYSRFVRDESKRQAKLSAASNIATFSPIPE